MIHIPTDRSPKDLPMRLLVLGATGGTGKLLVPMALAAGHEVTVLVRRPDAVASHPRLRVVAGSATDSAALQAVTATQDAVISTLGNGKSVAPTSLYEDSARELITAMTEHKVRRFVGVTSSGVVDDRKTPLWFRLYKKRLRHVYADMRAMEKVIRASDLDWTLVRPGYLTDRDQQVSYRVAPEAARAGQGWKISRHNLATFLLELAETPGFVRQAVAVNE